MRLLNIFFIVVLVGSLLMPTVNAGLWWDSGYSNREEVIIYNRHPTNDIMNYSFETPINYSGKTVLNDLNDSRFVWERHSDGTTYEADRINTTAIDTNGVTNITLGTYTITTGDFNLSGGGYSNDSTQSIYRLWHYYNSPSAGAPPDDIDNMYYEADECDNADDMVVEAGAPAFSNGIMTIQNGGVDEGVRSNTNLSSADIYYEVRVKTNSDSGDYIYVGSTDYYYADASNNDHGFWINTGHTSPERIITATETSDSQTTTTDTTYDVDLWRTFGIHYTLTNISYYYDDIYQRSYTINIHQTPSDLYSFVIAGRAGATYYVDYVRVREYVSPEPTYQFGEGQLNKNIINITFPLNNSETSNATINITIFSNSSMGWVGDFNISIDGDITDTLPAINGTQTYTNSSLPEGPHTITVSGKAVTGTDGEDTITLIVNRTHLIMTSPLPGASISVSDVNFTWTCNGSSNSVSSSWVNLNGSITYNSSPVTLGVLYNETISLPNTGTYTYNITCEFYNESWGSYNETSEDITFTRVSFLVNLSILDEETGLYLNKTLNISIKNLNYTVMSSEGCLHSCILTIPFGTSGVQAYLFEASWPGGSPTWTRQILMEIDYNNLTGYNASFYMPDNDTDSTIYSNLFYLDDPSTEYIQGLLEIKKYINTSLVLIHFTHFDIEDKVRTYLIGGDRYIFSVYNSDRDSSRSMGWYVPEDSNDKTLDIDTIFFVPGVSLAYNDVLIGFDTSGSNILVNYTDLLGQTSLVTIWIYNSSNHSQLLYTDSSSASEVLFSWGVPNVNKTYRVELNATHGTHGLISRIEMVSFPGAPRWDVDIPDWAKQIIALVIIGLITFFPTERDQKIGGLIQGLAVIFFSYIGFNPLPGIVLSLIALIIIIRRWTQ